MKNIKVFITSLLLLTTISMSAEKVTVSVASEFEPGKTVDVTVSLENTNPVAGYKMNLSLPEGFSLVYDEDEEDYVYELSNRHKKKHSMTITQATDGSWLFVVYSTNSGDVLKENSGELFTVQLKAAATVSSSQTASFKNIALSDADGHETAIDDVTFDLKIKGVPITVTAKDISMVYGDAVPELTYTAEGGTLNGTPALTCEVTSASPVGTYAIVAAQGTVTNEGVTFVNGTLTVTKAPLTISGGTYTMKQGEALPTFTATYAGFKNNEMESVLTKQPTLTTTATSASEPGTYDIVVAGAEAQNYDISYVKGTLTITAASGIGEVSAEKSAKQYYTLDGRKLQGQPMKKGVYVVNGRKVVKK